MDTRRVRVGCEFVHVAAIDTPAVVQVEPRDTATVSVLQREWSVAPKGHIRHYADLYSNACARVVLPTGRSVLRYDALVLVPDAAEDIDEEAPELPPEELPDDVLIYTLPSRYCLPDVLGDEAWSRFGTVSPGYPRVQAICDHVHRHLEFRYGSSGSWSTAADVNASRLGVCRDFTHLAIHRQYYDFRAPEDQPLKDDQIGELARRYPNAKLTANRMVIDFDPDEDTKRGRQAKQAPSRPSPIATRSSSCAVISTLTWSSRLTASGIC